MWVVFGLYMIIVIAKSVHTNSVKYPGDLHDEENDCYYKYIQNLSKNRFVNFIIKPSEGIVMEILTKTKNFEQPWTTEITKNTDPYKTSVKNTKKSLTVGIHHGPSYHMEFSQAEHPHSSGLSSCMSCNQHKERRNPTFNPWGGKRNSIPFKPDPKIRRPARVPFNSWGGKRQGNFFKTNWHEEVAKKRINDAAGIKKPFNSWGGKRTPFKLQSIYAYEQLFGNNI